MRHGRPTDKRRRVQGVELLDELVAELNRFDAEELIAELNRFNPEELITVLTRADRELFESLQNAPESRV